MVDGVELARVPIFISANSGFVLRTLSFVSFMISSFFRAVFSRGEFDVVVATSPQFFTAISGWAVSFFRRKPFVMEVRDLWPESLVAVGALHSKLILAFLTGIEKFLYRRAKLIIVVTNSFKEDIVSKGIVREKIRVVKNGVDFSLFDQDLSKETTSKISEELDLENKLVISYVGTIGMAHGLEVVLKAADIIRDSNVVFLMIGEGANKEKLGFEASERGLENVFFLGKKTREEVRSYIEVSSLLLVHLRNTKEFEKVIPSKIFEAMALSKAMICGLLGESSDIIRESQGGVVFTPENHLELIKVIESLKASPALVKEMGENGRRYAEKNHDRNALAISMLRDLQTLITN